MCDVGTLRDSVYSLAKTPPDRIRPTDVTPGPRGTPRVCRVGTVTTGRVLSRPDSRVGDNMGIFVDALRRSSLIVGYTLPMLLLFTPAEIPERYLWSWVAQHRGYSDTLLLIACPLLIMLAQWRAPSTVGASGPIVKITLTELSDATNAFSESVKLGSGGFGTVYGTSGALKSLAREGRCAVKRLHNSQPKSYEMLRREFELLGKCRHENLLPLLGVCLDPRALCLIYPLLVGGSLHDRLHWAATPRAADDASRRHSEPPLGWRERLRIVRDVTRALVYLHTPSGKKGIVLHRDVKPTNVLLDAVLNAKLADVELASEAHDLDAGRPHVSTSGLVGSVGFIDPIYANTGQYSQQTDGYAMGVTLLVCLTGRHANDALDAAADMLEDPTRAGASGAPLDPQTDWPAAVAVELAGIVLGLSWRRTLRARMPLAEALSKLEALSDASDTRPGIAATPTGPRECVVCMVEHRAVRYRCGHCICCEACTAQLERCPSCRVAPIHVVARGAALAFEDSFVST